MEVIIGALRGVWRVLAALVFFGLFPALACWGAIALRDGFGIDFIAGFVGVLGLELLFGVGALFGIASEVQKRHAERTAPGAQAS